MDNAIKKEAVDLKKDIHILSSELKKLGSEKEFNYQKKNKIETLLKENIQKAKDLRERKKDIDSKIKELKGKRSALNKELKQDFSSLKDLKNKLGKLEKSEPRDSSKYLKNQIEKLEFSIETDVLSFKKEKEYMDSIKQLKNKLKIAEVNDKKLDDLKEFRKKILFKKKKADDIHLEIQKLAIEGSKIFDELARKSDEISSAKKSKFELLLKIKIFNSKINKSNQNLGGILKNWSSLSSELQKGSAEDIMDKFKKKKRLTKDDILILQRKL